MLKPLASLLASALICCQCSVGYAAPKTVTLNVSGMTCATCPIAVKKALTRVEGVTSVDVSFEKKEATVAYDDAKVTESVLLKATEDAGFTSTIKKE